MTMVTEYDWESDTWTHHTGENAARAVWREAVAEIAEKAKATLPECNGRVDRAVAIVLNHDVELLEDGKAKVASQSNGTVVYHLVNGECSCKDYAKAPSNWCKHRIAAGLYKRATALVQRKLAQQNGASNGASNGQVDVAPAPAQIDAPPAQQTDAPAPTAAHAEARMGLGVEDRHLAAAQVLAGGVGELDAHRIGLPLRIVLGFARGQQDRAGKT